MLNTVYNQKKNFKEFMFLPTFGKQQAIANFFRGSLHDKLSVDWAQSQNQNDAHTLLK